MHNALAYHSGGDDSDIAIGTIYSDEINRVPNVFFRERFSCRYIRLVKRDLDRFARLISAPATDCDGNARHDSIFREKNGDRPPRL